MSQIKTDISADVEYEEHYLSYSALRQIVHQKTCEFVSKFCVRPQYIKLPLWVYQYSKTLSDFRCIDDNNGTRETFLDFTPCPTISIENPQDIEVF